MWRPLLFKEVHSYEINVAINSIIVQSSARYVQTLINQCGQFMAGVSLNCCSECDLVWCDSCMVSQWFSSRSTRVHTLWVRGVTWLRINASRAHQTLLRKQCVTQTLQKSCGNFHSTYLWSKSETQDSQCTHTHTHYDTCTHKYMHSHSYTHTMVQWCIDTYTCIVHVHRAYFKAGFTAAQILVINQLTMQQLHILHCTFRFYNCTYCDQLHSKICPACSEI